MPSLILLTARREPGPVKVPIDRHNLSAKTMGVPFRLYMPASAPFCLFKCSSALRHNLCLLLKCYK